MRSKPQKWVSTGFVNFQRPAIYFMLLSLTLCLLAPQIQAAETQTIQSLGTGIVVGSGVQKARDQAVSGSLVSAVSRVAAELLPQEGMVQYFKELNQTVFSNTDPFVLEYKVLAEGTSGTTYRVLVEATLSVDNIKARLTDAGFLRTRTTLPEILFMVSEQKADDPEPLYWWGWGIPSHTPISVNAMADSMRKAGFSIVDKPAAGFPEEAARLRQIPELSNADAVLFGTNSGAKVIIVGSARVQASNLMGEQKRTFQGIMEVRAIHAGTGDQIAKSTQSQSLSESDAYVGNHEVLSRIGTLAGEDLSSQLVKLWPRMAQTPSQISVVVQGTHQLSAFVEFRESIKTLPGVSEIFISEMKSDEAVISVDFIGDAKALAEAMMLNTYKNFNINIFETGPNLIRIKLMP